MICLLILICSIVLILVISKIFMKISSGRCESPACLIGKTALVVGGYRGIGYQIALGLASRGCRVIVADRINSDDSVHKIINATNNPNVEYRFIDLADFDGIREFVKKFIQEEKRLDILVNNAGSWGFGAKRFKYEAPMVMIINHYGSFLLTYLLTDLLKKSAPSRIIWTSSIFAFLNQLNEKTLTDDPTTNSKFFRELFLYGNGKLANIIVADEFAKRLKGSGVTANTYHPGSVATDLMERTPRNQYGWRLIIWVNKLFFSKTAKEGAQTALHLATSKRVKDMSGYFFMDCRPFFKPRQAYDPKFCKLVWETSERIAQIIEDERHLLKLS